jgi:hypothetical protein
LYLKNTRARVEPEKEAKRATRKADDRVLEPASPVTAAIDRN